MNRSDIKAKAMVVFRRGNEILLNEVREKDGTLKGYRPPGGHVEFGEKSIETARREIMEEIGAEIDNLKLLGVLESNFVYYDIPGHEIIFMYEASFLNKSYYQKDSFIAHEHSDNSHFELFWIDPDKLPSNIKLFPDNLHAFL
jgi:8-oxo-dGTP pyrophosphatase MutT (NUDIX family)